jgi:hypothetical protein
MVLPPTKGNLLRQVDGLRDIARRSRRLAETFSPEGGRDRLLANAVELERKADLLEASAADAKSFVIEPRIS